MIPNILNALLSGAVCLFLGLTVLHLFAKIPYDKIIINPHIATSTVVSIGIAINLSSSHIEGMLCFVFAMIGCYLGQLAFKKGFETVYPNKK